MSMNLLLESTTVRPPWNITPKIMIVVILKVQDIRKLPKSKIKCNNKFMED
jgi:hypothetical protein